MKGFLVFVFMFLVSTGITFFLTHKPVEEKKQIVKPFSVSSFSIEEAPTDSLRGKIATMSGEVWWQSRTASEPARLDQPREIMQGETILTKDPGSVALRFKEASVLAIEANAEVEIIQTLPANIVFSQKSGSITYEKPGIVPVSVKSGSLLIHQEEGTMRVAIDPEQTTVSVIVNSGNVSVAHIEDEITTVTEVMAGNSYVFDKATRTGQLQ